MNSGVNGKKPNIITSFNLRPITCAALGMVAGAAFCYAFLYLGVPFFAVAPIAFIPLVLLILSKSKKLAFFCYFVYIFFLIAGMGGLYAQLHMYDAQKFAAGEYFLEGEVSRVELSENGNYSVTVSAVFFDGDRADGNVILYVPYGKTALSAGDVIQTTVNIKPMGKAYRFGSLRMNMVRSNIKYSGELSRDPQVYKHNFKPFAVLNNGLKELLFENMDPQAAGLAFAMTTGDTTYVESGVLNSARYGGVAHLFAVSGLHIGILFAGMGMLFKKFRLPDWVKILFSVAIGFTFCGVCNFTPSSVRAFIICSILLVTRALHFGGDNLESASLAVVILLLISPVNLFSAGFLLSFSAYFGISVLAPQMLGTVRNLGHGWGQSSENIKIKWLNTAFERIISILAVQVCILPVQLTFFGYVSLWGLLFNFFLLPVFSLFFPFLLATISFSAVFPIAAPLLLKLASGWLDMLGLLFQVTDFEGVFLYGFSFSMVTIVAYVIMLMLGTGKLRGDQTPLVLFLVALIGVDTVLTNFTPVDCKVYQMSYYNDFCAALVQSENTNVLIVNQKIPQSRTQVFLNMHTSQKLDAVIVVSDQPSDCITSLLQLDFEEIYVYSPVETGLQMHKVTAQKQFTLGGVSYQYQTQTWLTFSYQGVTVSFGTDFPNVNFIILPEWHSDGLIFSVKDGILLENRS